MDTASLVRLALQEDLGGGDITTESTVPVGLEGTGRIRAKQELVVAGHVEAAETFAQRGARYEALVEEGALVQAGELVARIHGPLRAVLTAERVALNFLMHLSGIATHTRRVVAHAAGLRVVDTRKTAPLLRAPQRRAVRLGGGANHRFALYDGVLIKDNHIVAAGGVGAAVRAARARAHHLLRIEVEVETAQQAQEAVDAGADVIMLDNMSDAQMAAIIDAHRGAALFEASGNMSAERLPGVAAAGVDVVSIGGLIHQARWVDLSLKLDPLPSSGPTGG
jgi:nicotinate-nucleotide pyrophosphorylase (carboxylating)